jgi:hypothetical protein
MNLFFYNLKSLVERLSWPGLRPIQCASGVEGRTTECYQGWENT